MKTTFRYSTMSSVAALVILILAGSAAAQLEVGNIYGTVKDTAGEYLPGATLTLSGSGSPDIKVSNAEGQFRFLELSPGSYELTVKMDGFKTKEYSDIEIRVGRDVTIEATLTLATVETH